MLLIAAVAIAIWKFGAGLPWRPTAAPAGDGIGEEGNGATQ